MNKSSLSEFIGFLDGLKKKDFHSKIVENYFEKHHVDQGEFARYIFFREETYGRNLVTRGKNFELLVMTWLPGQKTPIHDHNGQQGWVIISSGKLAFRNYKPVSKTKGELLPCGPLAIHSAGEIVYMDEETGIHSISNQSSKPAVSIHLYAGPIKECRVFDEATNHYHWQEMEALTTGETSLLS